MTRGEPGASARARSFPARTTRLALVKRIYAPNNLFRVNQNIGRADTFIEEIRSRFNAISCTPLAYLARPEIKVGVRACVHGHYVIFYYVTDTAVEIARVLHGARRIARLFQP